MISKKQKGSVRTTTSVIVAIIVLVLLGYLIYKQYLKNNSDDSLKETATPENFSLDINASLGKLFPKITFANGNGNLSGFGNNYSNIKLYLKERVNGSFVNAGQKNALLVTQIDGIQQASGLFHVYLGVFDNNGNLLTPSSSFPSQNNQFQENSHFGADQGRFGFYNCQGKKYILFASESCPIGSCCNGGAKLITVKDGLFKTIQEISGNNIINYTVWQKIFNTAFADTGAGFGTKIMPEESGLKVYKVNLQPQAGPANCDYQFLKQLTWDNINCVFK